GPRRARARRIGLVEPGLVPGLRPGGGGLGGVVGLGQLFGGHAPSSRPLPLTGGRRRVRGGTRLLPGCRMPGSPGGIVSPCPALRAALVAVALLVAGGPAGAAEPDYVEVAPDTPYPPGTRVGLTALGLSFEIPPDWIGRMPAGSEFLFLASHTEPGLVLVTARKATLDEARAFFAQPLPPHAATVAHP